MSTIFLQKKQALKKLKQLTQNKMEESREHGIKVREKRASKKQKLPDFSLSTTESLKKKANTNDVKQWFINGIEKNYSGKVTNPLNSMEWNTRGKQGMLANKILSIYGAELTEKTIAYFCDNWEIIIANSNGRLSGLPTIEILWAMRMRIFADVELGRNVLVLKKEENKSKDKIHMTGEFDRELVKDRSSMVGW